MLLAGFLIAIILWVVGDILDKQERRERERRQRKGGLR